MQRQDRRLRLLLSAMTRARGIDKHLILLKRISSRIPNGLKVLCSNYEDQLDQYNCVMHALNLVDRLEHPPAFPAAVYAKPEFIQYLIDHGHLKKAHFPKQGMLVVYFHNKSVRHIGKLAGRNCVVSKWGIGNLYQHGLFEVPLAYGNKLLIFRHDMSPAQTIDLLAKF